MNEVNDHDRLIRVETEVHLIKEQQAAFEQEQKEDRLLLHKKIDTLTDLVQARFNQVRGIGWIIAIVATALGAMWGWLTDHVSIK